LLYQNEEWAYKEYTAQKKYVDWAQRHIEWLKREDYRKNRQED